MKTKNVLKSVILLAGITIAPSMLNAKIDLVTLPEREKTELTVYNSQDLTLVRETRTLAFSKGNNEIQFSWANTLIDPTSLQIDLGNGSKLQVMDAVYPRNSKDLIVWNIEAKEDVSAPVEISFFCSGLGWDASYVLRANKEETKLELQQFTTVTNNSGEDFVGATTRVVVGEVRLLEAIAELARRGIIPSEKDFASDHLRKAMREGRNEVALDMVSAMATPSAAGAPMGRAQMEEAKAIIKQAVSEYQVFTVEGTEDIMNGWGKMLPEKPIADISFDLSYELDANVHGPQPVKFYKFKNTEKHKLGKDTLPGGVYKVYSSDGRDGVQYEGTVTMKTIARGDDIDVNLGADGLVVYEERVVATKRSDFDQDPDGNVRGWHETHTVELELRNSRDRAVPVKFTHSIAGDWSFETITDKDFEQVDQARVRWNLILQPNEKKIIRYDKLVRMGSKARR